MGAGQEREEFRTKFYFYETAMKGVARNSKALEL
jgi:hypothetical protein